MYIFVKNAERKLNRGKLHIKLYLLNSLISFIEKDSTRWIIIN